MNDELKELETITKEYLNKLHVLLQKAKKPGKPGNIYDIKKPLENMDYISTIHDITTALNIAWEILSGMGKFNTIKKYDFTQQELRILLCFDFFKNKYFNDKFNVYDFLGRYLMLSTRTIETHFKNIANKITDILAPYINSGEIDYIETNENNNAKKPQQLIKNFLWEFWHYLK